MADQNGAPKTAKHVVTNVSAGPKVLNAIPIVTLTRMRSAWLAWVLIAEPQNAQSSSDYGCGTLCLYSTGQRGATAPVDSDTMYKQCWAR